jgi:hypothetical protein
MSFKDLIGVRPPYFALRAIELRQPGFVQAAVRPEHPMGHEVGALAAAEAGRHLAILGACACSSIREPVGRHYYLAHRARLVQHQKRVAGDESRFEGVARSTTRTGHEATASAALHATRSGELLFELDISYKVLSQPAFQRIYAAHRKDLRAMQRDSVTASDEPELNRRRNPYLKALPLEITRRAPQSVRALLPEVSPQLCAGHFPFYPALPVAMLMHSLVTLSGEALRVRWGDAARYRVMAADVSADRLVFAGERVQFEATYQRSAVGREHYQATATLADGTAIGRMALELEPIGDSLNTPLTAAPDLRLSRAKPSVGTT